MKNYQKILRKFSQKTLLVVGDIILDQHVVGSVSRISPEAPVPVVLEEKSFYSPGGAANVSQNLCALGAKVLQVGKIGKDLEGRKLKAMLKKISAETSGIFVDSKSPTITKTRIIAQHQQVVRIDREQTGGGTHKLINKKVWNFILKNIDRCQGIIVSDYGKGVVSPELISSLRDLALEKKKILIIDPKVEHFGYYRNVTAITPNKKEAENAIRDIKIRDKDGAKLGISSDQLDSDELIDKAGNQLLDYLRLDCLLMTLGEQGMRLFEKGKNPVKIKTVAKEVYDVTGAGDSVISVFALSLTAGASKREAAELSNIAAGIVVGKMGAVAATKKEMLDAIRKQER